MKVLVETLALLLLAAVGSSCPNDNFFDQFNQRFDHDDDCSNAVFTVGFNPGMKFCSEIGTRISIANIEYFLHNPVTKPVVEFKKAKPNQLYTILMLDPDAPSAKNPIMADWIHWGVSNVKGEDLVANPFHPASTGGSTFVEYQAPCPPTGSGMHRYRTMLLEQREELNVKLITERSKFDWKKFAADHDLKEIASSTFMTERT